MSATRTCWQCKTEYPAYTVVCTRCGINLESGEILGPEPSEEDKRIERSLPALLPGWFSKQSLLLGSFLGIVAIAMGVGGFVTMSIGGLGRVATAIIVGSIALQAQAAIVWLTGEWTNLVEGLSELEGLQWTILLALLPLPLLAGMVWWQFK